METQKNYIVKKAGELFNLYGLKSVTMDDISRELGISKKTLYVHFDSKKTLIELLLEQSKEQFEIRCKRLQNQEVDSLKKLYNIFNELIEFSNEISTNSYWSFKKYYSDLNIKFNNYLEKLIDEASTKAIIEAQWDQHIISTINAKVFNQILRNSILNLPIDNVIHEIEIDRKKLQKDILYFTIRSVTTISGLTQLDRIIKI